ncbi:MAG: 2-oxo acid dehydrogenase subunit E2, partial [Treponema sp.]|nr:2-oxo acid dehydrogenase subunit E2 [Treponema sp.]
GNTVESCIITDWKVKEGDRVTEETTVCEVETDKASFEIPAGACGMVLKILHNTGDDVPVLSPIAVIGEESEELETFAAIGFIGKVDNKEDIDLSLLNPNSSPDTPHLTLHTPDSAPHIQGSSASPRALNLAQSHALPLNTVPGTGPQGRIIERDVSAALEKRPALTAAAKARYGEILQEHGKGLDGRITLDEINVSFNAPHSSLNAPGSALPEYTETPVKGIRKVIADRMHKSLSETSQFTLNSCANAVKMQDVRSRLKTLDFLPEDIKSLKITVNDLILFAVSRILPRFLYMNAHKTGDSIKIFNNVHLGNAVDTERGLMVPVIRNANLLSLAQISSEAKRLATACQSGGVKPDELSGSTFSVTNLGSLGITGFTPVLNIPEVAILGVCGIELKPVSSNAGAVSFEPHIGFSLTINHEAVDGAPAARFLKALCEAVANIDLLLSAG